MKAQDLIDSGECVVAIFTHGAIFNVNPDHTGSTGNWKIDLLRKIDRVIVYHRNDNADTNRIYIGSLADTTESNEEKLYVLQLEHIQYIGTTPLNWKDFADTGQNPVRYLSK